MSYLKTSKIDLVILSSASILLKYSVIYYGDLIFCKDEKIRIKFQIDTINKYMDFKTLQRSL